MYRKLAVTLAAATFPLAAFAAPETYRIIGTTAFLTSRSITSK